VSVVLILAGGVLLLVHTCTCTGIGANLIAAGLVAGVFLYFYDGISNERSQAQVRTQMGGLEMIEESCERIEDHNRLVNVAKKVGLEACYKERPGIEINEAVLAAKNQVDILEVSLDTMAGVEAEEWLRCEARVRIILLDPKFPPDMPLARLRDREENELLEDSILHEVHATLRSLPPAWSAAPVDPTTGVSQSGVRLARLMPTMSYFRIDGGAYFAPLVHKRLGNETLHMRFREEGDFFSMLAINFEKLWKNTAMVKPPDPSYLAPKSP
jgi:hypothetical protein